MTKMTVQELHNEIAGHLGDMSDLFVPGMKLTFIARMPGNGEADVLVGDDQQPEELISLVRRRFNVAPAEQSPQAPCGESIDSPEFSKLLEQFEIEAYSFGSGNPNQELDAARAALIAHIDAKLTAARCVPEWSERELYVMQFAVRRFVNHAHQAATDAAQDRRVKVGTAEKFMADAKDAEAIAGKLQRMITAAAPSPDKG